jgi:hypothetical protein
MNGAELTEFVIQQLGRGISTDDLIAKVCEDTGRSWPDAEAFVRGVQASQASQIARRQTPLLLLITLPTLLGGAAIAALCGYTLLDLARVMDRQNLAFPLAGLLVIALGNWQVFLGLLLGLGMIVGSGIGIGQMISSGQR